jgi:hypothetical protein
VGVVSFISIAEVSSFRGKFSSKRKAETHVLAFTRVRVRASAQSRINNARHGVKLLSEVAAGAHK